MFIREYFAVPDRKKGMGRYIHAVPHRVGYDQRKNHYRHAGAVIWITGLPGAGKSSLAMGLEQKLMRLGYSCYVLDGDNIRGGINSNLSFSPEDRSENIRRVGEVAALFADAGLICISAVISPYIKDRARAKAAVRNGDFFEVYVRASLEICERRDPKGLYAKARRGELNDFTGVSAPYEVPINPDLIVDTEFMSLESCLEMLTDFVKFKLPLT